MPPAGVGSGGAMTMLSPGSLGSPDEARRTDGPVVEVPDHQEPVLPTPRGPITEHLLHHLRLPVHEMPRLPAPSDDPIEGEDVPLALHLLYELHYRGFYDVDEAWEWEPSLLRERQRLERAFEARLMEEAGAIPIGMSTKATRAALVDLAADTAGADLAERTARVGTLDQVRELLVHRSAHQLRAADPHTWGIPRLRGQAKAALAAILAEEHGHGAPGEQHATLFAGAMDELGVDSRYGAHLDRIPGVTLATGNLISLFGLHRRWRAALVGHLALHEMRSVRSMACSLEALRRLGRGNGSAARFVTAHLQTDEEHAVLALDELVGGLLEEEPILGGEIVFGARALHAVERRFAEHVLDRWAAGQSSLRPIA